MSDKPARAPDILMVIPDTRVRALSSAQLEEEGYDVLPLSSLLQAFHLLQRGVTPRLVILDTHGLSEYGEDILALTRITSAPVLLLTSAVDPNPLSEEKIRAHPQLTVLPRPFAISDLVKKAKTLIQKPA